MRTNITRMKARRVVRPARGKTAAPKLNGRSRSTKPSTINHQPSTTQAPSALDTRHSSLGRIAVIGLGYVGLPLSLQFARSGVSVVGLDIDSNKIEALNAGRSYIEHVPPAAIARLVKEKKFSASTDFARIREVDAVIICVPTPLNKNREPDISYIL